jgi:hypothetical protein
MTTFWAALTQCTVCKHFLAGSYPEPGDGNAFCLVCPEHASLHKLKETPGKAGDEICHLVLTYLSEARELNKKK